MGEIGGTGGFTDRGDATAADWQKGDLTTDGATHNLDISSVVGKGTKLVLINVFLRNAAAGKSVSLFHPAHTGGYNTSYPLTQAANVYISFDCWVMCNSAGVISYVISNVVWDTIDLTVRAWIS